RYVDSSTFPRDSSDICIADAGVVLEDAFDLRRWYAWRQYTADEEIAIVRLIGKPTDFGPFRQTSAQDRGGRLLDVVFDVFERPVERRHHKSDDGERSEPPSESPPPRTRRARWSIEVNQLRASPGGIAVAARDVRCDASATLERGHDGYVFVVMRHGSHSLALVVARPSRHFPQ
ncbi:MAG: hypothetical protein KJN63_12410, partial [Acidimicrobiia bacterium]|nr:hypothetical protein [Acidimicrobiia bacterium]